MHRNTCAISRPWSRRNSFGYAARSALWFRPDPRARPGDALFIDSRPVAKETIRRLGLRITPDELLDNLIVEPLEGTMLIQLTYTDTDSYRAKDVVNTVSQVASERISNTGGILSHITAVVWRKANLPNTPVSPKPLRNGLIALVVALALSAALMIAVRERLRR